MGENGQNFSGEKETWGESGVAADAKKTWEVSDVQNGREVKSQLTKCRLIEACYLHYKG